jgi:hypothetical protein
VLAELGSPGAPEAVRHWIEKPSGWLDIQTPRSAPDLALLQAKLGPGEQEAIVLAQELNADELLMDDMGGRREARRRHLSVTGTVGVLRAAAKLGLLDLRDALERLRIILLPQKVGGPDSPRDPGHCLAVGQLAAAAQKQGVMESSGLLLIQSPRPIGRVSEGCCWSG